MYRVISLLLVLFLISSHSNAQPKLGWRLIDQNYYGMKYKLPKSWEVDGFSSSSVCDCAGTINIGQRFEDDELFMVAYPSNSEDDLYKGSRTYVWGWQFEEIDDRSEYQTEYLNFSQTISRWTRETAESEEDLALIVWRFTTSFKSQHYVLYFWGNPGSMDKYETTIYQILDNFKAVKVSKKDAQEW